MQGLYAILRLLGLPVALFILLQVSIFLFRKNQPAKKEEISLKELEAEALVNEPCRKETVDSIEEIK